VRPGADWTTRYVEPAPAAAWPEALASRFASDVRDHEEAAAPAREVERAGTDAGALAPFRARLAAGASLWRGDAAERLDAALTLELSLAAAVGFWVCVGLLAGAARRHA
jgi:hypothetical protein